MQSHSKNSTQNPFSDGERFAEMAFKWNLGWKINKLSEMAKMAEKQNKLMKLCFVHNSIPNFHSKICLRMVRVCQNGL